MQYFSFLLLLLLFILTKLLRNVPIIGCRLKDPSDVINAFNVDPLYLKHDQQGAAPDYRVSSKYPTFFHYRHIRNMQVGGGQM